MTANGMRQIEERHVASCIEMMVWCNRMDLLALSNTRGEVQLHRLNWQRVWNLPPPTDNSLVRAMVWRPDGKVLAVGYSCGTTYLVGVEDKEILDSIKPGKANDQNKLVNYGSVTCLSWQSRSDELNPTSAYNNYDTIDVFVSNTLATEANYKKNEENTPEFKQFVQQTCLNILLVGYENGELHMFVFGLFPCGVIDLKKIINAPTNSMRIIDAQLSNDLTTIRIFEKDSKDNNLKLILLDTEALAAYSDELHSLATKHYHMDILLSHTDQTMTSIIEAWEQILLEMDSKLEKYASDVPEGGISADFLDLLMLGVPSPELEIFLLKDLTAKGLKKFGTSVELSYSTIQKLVLKQLNTVGHDISYHLAELRGLARITHRYKILGLEEDAVTEAILSSSAFINKCLELQQVIDHAMKNYKAFFRWLYIVIVRLMDEHAPAEIVKITQQDLTYIAEFLLNFDKVGMNSSADVGPKEKKGRFNLERLGQYLTDKDLTITPENENPWHTFVNSNPCIANNLSIVKNFKKFSLVQQQNHLKASIQKVFNCSEKSLATQFSLLYVVNCTLCSFDESLITGDLKVTQMHTPEEKTIVMAFTDVPSSEKGFYFLEVCFNNDELVTKCCYFYFHALGNINDSKLEVLDGANLKVIDVQFYSADVLSILLEQPDDDMSVFVQFPVKLARANSVEVDVVKNMYNIDSLSEVPKINAFSLLEAGMCKILDKISGWRIAVSGGRKVAVVLSKTCRKVRLFEMEVDGEEDDDETPDTTPQSHSTTQHSDTSQHMSMNESGVANISSRVIDQNLIAESIDSDTFENY
ncbi:anaphase-promoting complex subunit 4 [Arctopsyche grandis]|uniref:anaphase-promoting complex subunit 4 n=1 Tax=Arctopsyche grandis TaxID=121162 RepID=UPI00406D708F